MSVAVGRLVSEGSAAAVHDPTDDHRLAPTPSDRPSPRRRGARGAGAPRRRMLVDRRRPDAGHQHDDESDERDDRTPRHRSRRRWPVPPAPATGRLRRADRQPVPPDAGRRPVGVRRTQRRGAGAQHGHGDRRSAADPRHPGGGGARRGDDRWRGHRGHLRLVRAGPPRERLVPRRGHRASSRTVGRRARRDRGRRASTAPSRAS